MKVNRKEIQRLKAQAAALMEQASAVEDPVPETPAGRRRLWVKELQLMMVEAFDPDDPHANADYLNGLKLMQLHELYQACVRKGIGDWKVTNPPKARKEAKCLTADGGRMRMKRSE